VKPDACGAAVGALLVAMTSVQSRAALATTLFPAVGSSGTAAIRLCLAALILAAI
jgi:inner membrane transporter RhtA